ncbi:MAG: sulfite exporter TauE/SafE family protein [Deinococcales bacterium]
MIWLDVLFPLLTGLAAGGLGAMLGLGGGVVVVPTIELLGSRFLTEPYTLQQVIAASQLGVLSVAVASSAGYLAKGSFVRFRAAYAFAPFTVFGGIVGSLLLVVLEPKLIATIFALLLCYTAFELIRGLNKADTERPNVSKLAKPALVFSGVMSGLLGIGGGTIQVPVLNLLVGFSFRVAVATSTFMMGFTAIANASIQIVSGKLEPGLAGAVALGILIGARIGSQWATRVPVRTLKLMFAVLVLYSAFDLFRKYWL